MSTCLVSVLPSPLQDLKAPFEQPNLALWAVQSYCVVSVMLHTASRPNSSKSQGELLEHIHWLVQTSFDAIENQVPIKFFPSKLINYQLGFTYVIGSHVLTRGFFDLDVTLALSTCGLCLFAHRWRALTLLCHTLASNSVHSRLRRLHMLNSWQSLRVPNLTLLERWGRNISTTCTVYPHGLLRLSFGARS